MVSVLAALLTFVVTAAVAPSVSAQAPSTEPPRDERRTALVIGNGAYQNGPLRNPVRDAKGMARVLRGQGFEVMLLENAGQKETRRAINDFGKKLRDGGVGLFYYAGHGLQVNGRNYLVPVDAAIEEENEVEIEAVDVGAVLSRMDVARNRPGAVDYPSLGCSGWLTIVERTGVLYRFRERIERGGEACVNGGLVEMRLTGHGSIQIDWYFPEGSLGATSVLRRTD